MRVARTATVLGLDRAPLLRVSGLPSVPTSQMGYVWLWSNSDAISTIVMD